MNLTDTLDEWFSFTDLDDDLVVCDLIDALTYEISNSSFKYSKKDSIIKITSIALLNDDYDEIPHTIIINNQDDISSFYLFIKKYKDIPDEMDFACTPDLDVQEWSKNTRKNHFREINDEINDMIMDNMFPDGYDPDNTGIDYD